MYFVFLRHKIHGAAEHTSAVVLASSARHASGVDLIFKEWNDYKNGNTFVVRFPTRAKQFARCSRRQHKKNLRKGGPSYTAGRLLTLGWNQLEELCLDWLSDARVCFR